MSLSTDARLNDGKTLQPPLFFLSFFFPNLSERLHQLVSWKQMNPKKGTKELAYHYLYILWESPKPNVYLFSLTN